MAGAGLVLMADLVVGATQMLRDPMHGVPISLPHSPRSVMTHSLSSSS
jgi:hypothetical protein